MLTDSLLQEGQPMAKLMHFCKRVGKYQSILSSWNPNISYIKQFRRRNLIKEVILFYTLLTKFIPKRNCAYKLSQTDEKFCITVMDINVRQQHSTIYIATWSMKKTQTLRSTYILSLMSSSRFISFFANCCLRYSGATVTAVT